MDAHQAASGSAVEAGQAGLGPAVDAVQTEAPETVDGFDLADLNDLAEAPSHAHDIEQKLMATFPGAKLTVLPEPGEDDTAGGA